MAELSKKKYGRETKDYVRLMGLLKDNEPFLFESLKKLLKKYPEKKLDDLIMDTLKIILTKEHWNAIELLLMTNTLGK